MLSLNEIIDVLRDRNLAEISRTSGIPYPVLWRLKSGKIGNPSYATIKRVSDYLTATGYEECPRCRDRKS